MQSRRPGSKASASWTMASRMRQPLGKPWESDRSPSATSNTRISTACCRPCCARTARFIWALPTVCARPGCMPPKAFLLTSLSGRILAKAAARAQRSVVGIDAFADQDTCGMALKWTRSPLDRNGEFDATAMLDAADSVCPPAACLGQNKRTKHKTQPALLRGLSEGRIVLGNSPEVLESVADPERFSNLLCIPHPATRMSRPAE